MRGSHSQFILAAIAAQDPRRRLGSCMAFEHWRRVATRYDTYALTFLGGVILAALITHHRIRH